MPSMLFSVKIVAIVEALEGGKWCCVRILKKNGFHFIRGDTY